MIVTTDYICGACNDCRRVLDWSCGPFPIYGLQNCIAMLTDKVPFIVKKTLTYHEAPVKCVKWINTRCDRPNDTGNIHYFISGASDKKVALWRGAGYDFSILCTSDVHKSSVYAVDGICVDRHILIASCASEPRIALNLIERTAGSIEKTISIDFDYTLPRCVKLFSSTIFKSEFAFIGCEDFMIKIYSFSISKLEPVLCYTVAGHEDWVECLDVIQLKTSMWMISGSLDNYIRVWKIEKFVNLDDNKTIQLKSKTFELHSGTTCSLTLDSVLLGHEDFVCSLAWSYAPLKDDAELPVFLSSSADSLVIVWHYDQAEKLWMDKVRAGEVGGANLGYNGAVFNQDSSFIIAFGFRGALHAWHFVPKNSNLIPVTITSGHSNPVRSLCWEENGNYFLTVSEDMSTRLHARCCVGAEEIWHEIGRPQSHGYPMRCIVCISFDRFVSGAEEKVLRLFRMPLVFAENFSSITHIDPFQFMKMDSKMPIGAISPALGLSNKPIFDVENNPAPRAYTEVCFKISRLKEPPSEEHLIQNTLWPEEKKLYGHDFEIAALSFASKRGLLASSCKATKVKDAEIFIWIVRSEQNLEIISKLAHHHLTVVDMSFSHDENYLLAVSRDRTWSLWHFDNDNNPSLVNSLAKNNPFHTRIILSCAWSMDDEYFFCASRDKRVCVWKRNNDANPCPAEPKLDTSNAATAIAITQDHLQDDAFKEKKHVVAVGLEDGKILIFTWSPTSSWNHLHTLEDAIRPVGFIHRLQFRPSRTKSLELTCASDDHTVRLFSLNYLNN